MSDLGYCFVAVYIYYTLTDGWVI